MSTEEVLKRLLVTIKAIGKSLDLWQALTCGGTFVGGFFSLSDLSKIKGKLGVDDFRGYVKDLHGRITLDDDFKVAFAFVLDEVESRSKLQTFLEREWKNAGESIFEYGFDGEKLDDFRSTAGTDVLKKINADLLGLFIELDKTLHFLSLSDALHAIIPYRYKSVEENRDELLKLVKKPNFKRQMEKVRAFVSMEMQRQEAEMRRRKERAGDQEPAPRPEDGASLQTDGEASTGKSGGKAKGRPKKPFSDFIVNDPDGKRLNAMHAVMEGKMGRDVALVVVACMDMGWIINNPSFASMEKEFGKIGSRQGVTKYKYDKTWFDDAELERMKINLVEAEKGNG